MNRPHPGFFRRLPPFEAMDSLTGLGELHLVFSVGKNHFAVPFSRIRSMIRPTHPDLLDRALEEGVLILDGEEVPIFDLVERFRQDRPPLPLNHHVLLLTSPETPEDPFCLVVDRLHEVSSLHDDCVSPVHPQSAGSCGGILRALFHLKSRYGLLLDVEQIGEAIRRLNVQKRRTELRRIKM